MRENDPDLNKLYNWDKDFVWHAFTQMAEYEPLLIERGEGVYLFDTDGNRYIDVVQRSRSSAPTT